MDKWVGIFVSFLGILIPIALSNFTNKVQVEKSISNNWLQRNFGYILYSFTFIYPVYHITTTYMKIEKNDFELLIISFVFWYLIYTYFVYLNVKLFFNEVRKPYVKFEDMEYELLHINKSNQIIYLTPRNELYKEVEFFLNFDDLRATPIILKDDLYSVSLSRMKKIIEFNSLQFKKYFTFAIGNILVIILIIAFLVTYMILKQVIYEFIVLIIFGTFDICILIYIIYYCITKKRN
ncbi:hypothetical protein [Macrococcus sp. DPC7161]|uniref:hypothetical protein n=1 Tax=Macrococcus sp. DPC7161 TaxID=2507060 RepID=UPI00100BD33C|nr:hypothetical protein [Macrococcus sp. DPC7161]RXK17485.1 hypothetical protein ER639_10095 [Macrococcus sp. DPC7161]